MLRYVCIVRPVACVTVVFFLSACGGQKVTAESPKFSPIAPSLLQRTLLDRELNTFLQTSSDIYRIYLIHATGASRTAGTIFLFKSELIAKSFRGPFTSDGPTARLRVANVIVFYKRHLEPRILENLRAAIRSLKDSL
jgi:hypothetical protein